MPLLHPGTSRRRAVLLLCVATLAVAWSGPVASADVSVDFYHINDLGTATDYPDDLYTATLGLRVATPRFRVSLYEHMFTDGRNDVRFDETYLELAGLLPRFAGLEMRAEIGAVRVGEGIFGQTAQNRVHRLIDSPEVFHRYVVDTGTHATLRFDARRPFSPSASLEIGPRIEVYEAFDFKRHRIVEGTFAWRAGRRLTMFGNLGARHSEADLAELDRWVDGWAPAAAVGVRYTRFFEVAYSYNAFGTEDQHLHYRFRWVFGAAGRQPAAPP